MNSNTYRLPNEAELLAEKENIERSYKQELVTIEQQIQQNRAEYQFLHELLTESGGKLVKAVEMYLQWLGFDSVVNCDEVYAGQNEEDLQVTLEDGLLVIEVKGVGGTSKDNECSQISKIRYRRTKERQKVDVSALYIVNHQRYQPPANRTNPPFSKQQIEDALSDERGLLTTYELFKLFFAINEGFITKSDARKSLQAWGLVTFAPSNCVFLGTPKENHRRGIVVILEIENTTIKVGDELLVSDDGRYRRIKVISLQDNGVDVDSFRKGEAGIKLSDKVNSRSQIWLPIKPDNTNILAATDH